jgi:flagellin-specific chaperone FliS
MDGIIDSLNNRMDSLSSELNSRLDRLYEVVVRREEHFQLGQKVQELEKGMNLIREKIAA